MSAISGRACARALRHAVLLACVLPALGAATAGAAVPAGFYGVNSGGTIVTNAVLRAPALQAMGAGGLSFVRVDASWGAVEPAAPVASVHHYVWTVYDAWVADLARNGLRWYPMLGYSAPWASSVAGAPFAPPAGDANFAAFVAAVAARYGTGGTFWATHPELPPYATTVYGIWNEPSNDHFWHGPEATPARYMSLYLAAHAAIKAVDPAARVATAGLLDSGTIDGAAYLRAMLDSVPDARNQIDAVGWHPYVGDVTQVLASVTRARRTLEQYGLGAVPIEISEVGLLSSFGLAQRAQWVRDLAVKLPNAGLGVSRLMPYVWTGDPMWQLTDPDGTPGLVGGSYFQGISEAATYQPPAAAPASAPVAKRTAAKAKPVAAKTCRPAKKSAKRKAAKKTKKCMTTISRKARAKAARAKAAKARAKARAQRA